MRRFVPWCVVAFAAAGCSSGADETVTTDPAPASTTVDGSGAATAGESDAVPTTAPGDAEQTPAYVVAIDVSVDRLDLAERLEVAIGPAGLDEIDPFTRFSSCSGLRASVSTFAVTAVDATESVRSVSVVTVDRVAGPGVYDAEVRIETDAAGPVSAVGTMTLDQSLRSGSFQAFEPTGEIVTGAFSCDGPPGTPVPIVDADIDMDDGELRAVEVVALLRRGDEERIVGLTLDTAEVAAADAACPGATGDTGPMLVRVDGDLEVGAITTFELAAEPSPSLRMRVGGVSYDAVEVAIDVDDRGAAGTFSGVTADGIAIDGAFRCA